MNERGAPAYSPRTMVRNIFPYAFAITIYTISWFCLWNISRYLASDFLLAGLFLPTGLKLAVFSLTERRFWPLFTGAEIGLICLLVPLLDAATHTYLLVLFSVLAHSLAIPFISIWAPLEVYWKQLLSLCGLVLIYGISCGLGLLLMIKPLGLSPFYALEGALCAITGGILLTPFFFLLYDYLKRQIWQPLTPTLIHQEVTLRPSALLWVLLFFCIGLVAELMLLDQVEPLALLIFLLPNIFMAYRYGWQGGVLASMMNSVLLATARQVTGSFDSNLELQSFMATQALVGLGLGIAISRQYMLAQSLQHANQKLAHELHNKQQLARQLVHVEEDIRKNIARELHDEIGQNITAIQIQAMLAKRLASDEQSTQIAETTHQLAMRIHATTRQLLTQLRPVALDEMGLENAIRQLVAQMQFPERNVDFRLNFGIFAERLDEVTTVTLYRVVQELLNNVCKHSLASQVQLSLVPGDRFCLELRDNGIGLPQNWRHKGRGLIGIEERINALGGTMTIQSNTTHSNSIDEPKQGCRITVNLPTKYNTKSPI